jgi:hypothetical protein
MEGCAMAVDTSVLRTRRSLLAGAVGGLAATIGAALGRPSQAEAAAGSALIVGSETNNAGTSDTQLIANSSVVTFKLYQQGPGTALMGYTTPTTGATRGVYGRVDSPNGDGVQGRNGGAAGTGAAVRGYGVNNDGINGTTDNVNRYGVVGSNTASSGDGVAGTSGPGGSGVIGFSDNGNGVYGTSTGYGVHGFSTSGFAVYSEGAAKFSKYLDIGEITEPADPPANTARLFVRDTGGDTELCVKIGSTVYLIAPVGN